MAQLKDLLVLGPSRFLGNIYGTLKGNADTATKLANARKLKTNLGSTTDAQFDGSADQTNIPVTGTLGVANGGLGRNSLTANRLAWSYSTTELGTGYHYASNTKVAINLTTEPTENFYVNGSAKTTGALNVGDNIKLTSNDEGANIRLITAGNANNLYEFDTCNNELRLYYSTNGGGALSKGWFFSTDGTFRAPNIKITDANAVKHIEFARTNYNYITAPASGTIAFITGGKDLGAATADLAISNNQIAPGTTNTVDLGIADKRWKNVYSTDFNSIVSFTVNTDATNSNRGFIINHKGQRTARMATTTVGVAGDGTNAGTAGRTFLILGNEIANDAAGSTAGANNSDGAIRLYSSTAYYHNIYTAAATNTRTHYFPNATGWIATGGNGTSTGVGGTSSPVYLDTNGVLKTISYTIDKSVPSNAVFTDTNVKQTNSTVNAGKRLILSASANDTEETSQVYKSSKFLANPSTGELTATTFKGDASRAQLLRNFYVNTSENASSASRPTSANLSATGSGGLVTFKATSAMTTGKPPADSHILHMYWDNTGGYDAQLAVVAKTGVIYSRGCDQGTWTDWKTFLDSSNYTSYTVKKDGIGASGTWAINISGKATTAGTADSANAVAWANVSGKPSSFTPSSHTHISLKSNTDNRSINTVPNDYNGIFEVKGLKTNSVIGISNHGLYSCVLGARGWGDSSGGNSHEFALAGDGTILHRNGSTTAWGDWVTLINSGNYTDYTVTKNHTHSYLPLSGGTMTGGITFSANGPYIYHTASGTSGGFGVRVGPSTAYKYMSFNPDGKLYVNGVATSMEGHTHSYLPLSGGTITGTITHNGGNGTITADSTGAALLCGYGQNTGIFHGNGDNGVESLGTSATANLIIKSWYGVGFADGCTGNGITVGINCRTGRVTAKSVYGAVWNDYAEYRQADTTEPGRCIIENGDDTLSLSTKRLQRGCEIISDTFGFAIGETDDCKTPIAASGRVLAYPYEDREEFRKHIGWPVCSGPNGTVSIMTEEEEERYPSRIIGTISAVPDYEEWGTGNVKVNGRVWIRIK